MHCSIVQVVGWLPRKRKSCACPDLSVGLWNGWHGGLISLSNCVESLLLWLLETKRTKGGGNNNQHTLVSVDCMVLWVYGCDMWVPACLCCNHHLHIYNSASMCWLVCLKLNTSSGVSWSWSPLPPHTLHTPNIFVNELENSNYPVSKKILVTQGLDPNNSH